MRTRDISVVVVMLLFLLILPSSSESKMLRRAYRFWQSHKRFRYFPHHTKQQKQAQKPNRNTFCTRKRSSTREGIESLNSYFARALSRILRRDARARSSTHASKLWGKTNTQILFINVHLMRAYIASGGRKKRKLHTTLCIYVVCPYSDSFSKRCLSRSTR